jgi:hypothetical protein
MGIAGDYSRKRQRTPLGSDSATSFVPQQGHLSAMGGAEEYNKLLIVDSYANVKRIAEIVNTLMSNAGSGKAGNHDQHNQTLS